jgi:gliding motility-associated-like protein
MIKLSLDIHPLLSALLPRGVFLIATLFSYLLGAAQCPPVGITPSPAGIVYVNKQVTVSGNGSSWATAVKELADALPAAKTNTAIREIWVAQGTYTPLYDAATGCAGADPRDNAFVLVNSTRIYGGFTGTETDPSQRILNANPSILSGDIGAAGDAADNCYHVVISAGTVNYTLLDGLHITGGNATRTINTFVNGEIIFGSYAGGLYIKRSSPTIRDCYIAGNMARAYAGGVFIEDGNPTISFTNIENNNAGNGAGGVYVSRSTNVVMSSVTIQGNGSAGSAGGLANSGGNVTFQNSTINSNNAAENGGGFYQYSGTTTLTNSVINLNSANKNGGAFSKFTGDVFLNYCVMSGNKALMAGGGFDNGASDKLLITGCVIELNSAADGGAFENGSGTMDLTNVIIKGNSATGTGAAGRNSGNVTFSSGLITGNRAGGDGGGWLNNSGTTVFSDITIAGNKADGVNAGFYGRGQNFTFNNCIIWGNEAIANANLQVTNINNAAVAYSIIQGTVVWPGAGNGNADSLFTAPEPASAAPTRDGNYQLQPCSPATDAGNNSLIPAGITTDLNGMPRIYNNIVDMGCFEAQSSGGGSIQTIENIRICQPQLPYTWNGQTINSGGNSVATFTTTSTKGCDSTVTLNLEVMAAKSAAADISICQNQLPYLWNGQTIAAGGNGVATYITTSSEGCDSTVTLNLTVNATVTATDDISICQPQLPYVWNGHAIAAGGNGVATYTTTSSEGCDSTVTLNLTVNATVTTTDDLTICQSQLPYVWNGQTVTVGGNSVATYTTPSVNGCDSTVTLNLKVNPVQTSTENINICAGELPYVWHGQIVNTGGNGVATYTTVTSAGCDSIITLNLAINNTVTAVANISICRNQLPYSWNGQIAAAGGNAVATYTTSSSKGCDSTVTLNLTVNPLPTAIQNISICESELPYTWNGQTIRSGGQAVATYATTLPTGCDSITTLNLSVKPTPVLSVSQSVTAGCKTGVNLVATGATTYSWLPATWLSNPHIANPVANPPQTTVYTVTGTLDGCSSSYTIQVVPPVANDIPNAFSPNRDGRNDCFGIRFWRNVISSDISVFNRWGQLVFKSTDPNACWDGKFKGVEQPAGAYIYFIKVTTSCGMIEHKGTVMLIR